MKDSRKKRFIIIVLLIVIIAVGVVLIIHLGKKKNEAVKEPVQEPVQELENEPVQEPTDEPMNEPAVEYKNMTIRRYTLYNAKSEDYMESARTYENLLTYADAGWVTIGSDMGYYAYFYDTEYDYEIPSEEIKQLFEEHADEMDQVFLDNAEKFNTAIAENTTADFYNDPPDYVVDVTEYYPEEIIFTVDGVEFTFYVENVTFNYHFMFTYFLDEANIEEYLNYFKTPSPKVCDWKNNHDGKEWYVYVGGSAHIIDISGKYVITDENNELVEKHVVQTATDAVSEE